MSRSACVYVGPYAMWVDADAPTDEVGDVMFGDVLWGHWGPDGVGQIEPGQGAVSVKFFAPAPETARPGGPKRAHTYGDPPRGCVGLDFLDVDPKAEVEAFRTAYKIELDTMAQRVGRPPVLRWGMIYTYG